jgi:hypothetical protein
MKITLDYSVANPDTPTNFTGCAHHRLYVLDIVLAKLPSQFIQITNLSELSSDHNPILLHINDSLIANSPPQNNFWINWKKFVSTFEKYFPLANPQIHNMEKSRQGSPTFSKNVHTAVAKNSSPVIRPSHLIIIPDEIASEIPIKRREKKNI